jgi:mutator protein MutT
MTTADGHTVVEAAHIVPWSESKNDNPRNGLALCRLCHWTFDEGLLGLSAVYLILASPQLGGNGNLPAHLATLVGRVLLGPDEEALRPDLEAVRWHRERDRLGGLWEFPGGKIEDGEDPRACLARELHEEFGITAEIGEFLVSNVHHYPHIAIELLSYRATHVAGAFELRDHDEIRWVSPEEMGEYAFAPADLPTVAFLQAGWSARDGAQGE